MTESRWWHQGLGEEDKELVSHEDRVLVLYDEKLMEMGGGVVLQQREYI